MRLAAAAILLIGLIAAPAAARQTYRFPPRDTCASLSGASAFRARLARVASRRDAAALVAMASADVELDFGGGAGRKELAVRLRSPQGADLWRALDRLLPLGCVATKGDMVLPAFFAEDLGELDPFSVMLATGPAVALRSGRGAGAPVLRMLSWQLVEPVSADDYGKPWRRVKVLPAGPVGYVAGDRLRSPVDYRLRLVRQNGVWRIRSFIAGD